MNGAWFESEGWEVEGVSACEPVDECNVDERIGGVGYGAAACPEKERERLMCSVGGKPTEAKVRTS